MRSNYFQFSRNYNKVHRFLSMPCLPYSFLRAIRKDFLRF